jgi:hypothetical protein
VNLRRKHKLPFILYIYSVIVFLGQADRAFLAHTDVLVGVTDGDLGVETLSRYMER